MIASQNQNPKHYLNVQRFYSQAIQQILKNYANFFQELLLQVFTQSLSYQQFLVGCLILSSLRFIILLR